MNIESANLSPLISNSSMVESAVSPLADGSVVSEGFSDALVTQIQLLSNVATEDLLPVQVTDIAGLQASIGQQVTAALPVGKAEVQDFAALLGNDLPPTYKTKDDVDHEAALALVTDTLKYITMGKTDGEKAAAAEQNIKDVIAMAIPAEQNVKDTITVAIPAEQNVKDTITVTTLVEQNVKNTTTAAAPAEQNVKNTTTAAAPVEQIIKDTIARIAPAEQNIKDTIAMTIPVEQIINDTIARTAPAEQNITDTITRTVPTEQNIAGTIARIAPTEQNITDTIARTAPTEQIIKDTTARTAPAEQIINDTTARTAPAGQIINDTTARTTPAGQIINDTTARTAGQIIKDTATMTVPVKQHIKDTITVPVQVDQPTADILAKTGQSIKDAGVPAQMNSEQANDKTDKKPSESETQLAGVENNRGSEVLAASVAFTPTTLVEQGNPASNRLPADTIEEGVLLSFIKPSTGEAKPNQPAKVADNVLQSETVFRQPIQDKPVFNLNYAESAGQAEKTGRVEQKAFSLEGEKSLPRIGTDMTSLNRSIVENKAEVPAITKPLSHPEWNKDLGERIVWMSSKAIPSAEIRLNPEHLGPISVRVNVADDQATVVFTAQHAATRDALEASIPKLREMMGAQQLNLVDVSFPQGTASDQGRSQAQNFAQTADGRGQQGAAGAVIDGVDDMEQEIESGRAVVTKGLLSLYA